MTTNEKQLLSQMQSALSGEPAIAQALKPHLSGYHDPVLIGDLELYYSPRLNTIIVTKGDELEQIMIAPETLRALNEFAVRIGWQCD